jgi:hypothetical protein
MSNLAAIFTARGILLLLVIAAVLLLFQFTWEPRNQTSYKKNRDPWLIATICSASSIQRRMVIRATWQKLYKSVPMTTKFVLGKPDEVWKPVLALENEKYGDIMILENVSDDRHTANTIKSIELFRHLLRTGREYDLVTKMDDDSFLNAQKFWDKYLSSAMGQRNGLERTIIGRRIEREVLYPGGQFYTVTWDLLSVLVSLQDRFHITNQDEDWLVGTLLAKGDINWSLVELENSAAFDYDEEDARNKTTTIAKDDANQNQWSHALGPHAINPHKMKDDATYLRVAACFDEKGWKVSCS